MSHASANCQPLSGKRFRRAGVAVVADDQRIISRMRRVVDLGSFIQLQTILVELLHAERTHASLPKQIVVRPQKIDVGTCLRPGALATDERAAKIDIEQDDAVGRAVRRDSYSVTTWSPATKTHSGM